MRRDFDPFGLQTYQGLQPQIGSTLSEFMSNPWQAGYFQNALTRASESTGARTNTALQNLLANTRDGGLGNTNAFLLSQRGKIARGASRERADNLTNLLLGAQGLRQSALNQAMGYNPLELGQSSDSKMNSSSTAVEKTGGLGTWLPQLVGSLGGAFLGGMGGRVGGGGAGAGGGFARAGNFAPAGTLGSFSQSPIMPSIFNTPSYRPYAPSGTLGRF